MEIILLPLHICCAAASNQSRSRFSVTRRSLLPPLPLCIAPTKTGRWKDRSPLRMSVDLEPDQASSSSSSDVDLLDAEAQIAALRGMLFIFQLPFLLQFSLQYIRFLQIMYLCLNMYNIYIFMYAYVYICIFKFMCNAYILRIHVCVTLCMCICICNAYMYRDCIVCMCLKLPYNLK